MENQAGQASGAQRFLPRLIAIVFGPPALAAVALATLRPAGTSWAFAGGLAGATLLLALLARRRGPTGARVLLVVAAFGLFLWPEMTLRALSLPPDEAGLIQFGHPRPDKFIRLQRDPELFWKLPPGGGINSDGFKGPEFVVPKPANVTRVVFFGDSCTQQGLPRSVAKQLNARGGLAGKDGVVHEVEAINLGVSGYSSHQGRVLAERWTETLDPDAIVVYFGWNDHWLAYGATDAQRAQRAGAPLPRIVMASNLLRWLAATPLGSSEPLDVPRVSIEEFRDNVEAIGDTASAEGARVVLVTAPSTHEALGVPDYLVEKGFAASHENVVLWHRMYAAELRRIAIRKRWLMVDLLRATANEPDLPEYFSEDGIHFKALGMHWAGKAISDALTTNRSFRPVD